MDKSVYPFDASCFATGIKGEYFNNNTLSGIPAMERIDPQINFNWIFSSPSSSVDSRCFSVRWSGKLHLNDTFKGNIGFSSSDSMKLFVDGNLVLDNWDKDHQMVTTVPFYFEKNKDYDIIIEYKNDARGANVVFGYNKGEVDEVAALSLAKNSDLIILCMGENDISCGENVDRADINLPGRQVEFFNKVIETAKDKDIILILQNGRPLTIRNEVNNSDAVLECFFPGEEGGNAIADILLGIKSPSGRLPMSFPQHVGQIPVHYSRHPGGGLKYCDISANPLYPFGYGLTYTKFNYSNFCVLNKEIKAGDNVNITVDIENIGECYGEEVVQLYIRDVTSSVVKPVKELVDFKKIKLEKGEKTTVNLKVESKYMRTFTQDFKYIFEEGDFDIFVGSHSQDNNHKDSFYLSI